MQNKTNLHVYLDFIEILLCFCGVIITSYLFCFLLQGLIPEIQQQACLALCEMITSER